MLQTMHFMALTEQDEETAVSGRLIMKLRNFRRVFPCESVKSPPHGRLELENLYNILGVPPTATTDEIKKAYRTLAMRHHPDRSTYGNSEARFNAIKNAYEVLSNPKLRAEYNQSLNNRIILDPDGESRNLWRALFERCGVSVPHDDQPQR